MHSKLNVLLDMKWRKRYPNSCSILVCADEVEDNCYNYDDGFLYQYNKSNIL